MFIDGADEKIFFLHFTYRILTFVDCVHAFMYRLLATDRGPSAPDFLIFEFRCFCELYVPSSALNYGLDFLFLHSLSCRDVKTKISQHNNIFRFEFLKS